MDKEIKYVYVCIISLKVILTKKVIHEHIY